MSARSFEFSVPILTYHSIDNSGSIISVSPERFRNQMQYLSNLSFNVITLDEIIDCINKNRPFPPRSIAITFDDGFKNTYEIAYPLIRGFGFNATVFLVTGYCGRKNQWNGQPGGIPDLELLEWDEVMEMADNGIVFGAHTVNHPNLLELTLDQAEKEVVDSKRILEERTGQDISLFAYPYGDFNTGITNIVNQYFKGACSAELAVADIKSNPFALERIDAFYINSGLVFKKLFTPYVSYYLKCRRLLRDIRKRSLERTMLKE